MKEIIFYYKLGSDDFIRERIVNSYEEAKKELNFQQAYNRLTEYCFVLVSEPAEIKLKDYQTDSSLESRRKRKADLEMCEQMRIRGVNKKLIKEYTSKYSKAIDLHVQALGLFAPIIPSLLEELLTKVKV